MIELTPRMYGEDGEIDADAALHRGARRGPAGGDGAVTGRRGPGEGQGEQDGRRRQQAPVVQAGQRAMSGRRS